LGLKKAVGRNSPNVGFGQALDLFAGVHHQRWAEGHGDIPCVDGRPKFMFF